MSLRTYKYRIYPSTKHRIRFINQFKTCKSVYNELLTFSKDSYKFGAITLNKFDYNLFLKGKYPVLHSQVKQNVSDRVNKAFKNFFRRVKDKSCTRKGFPRFKSRVNSITFPQSGFKFVNNRRLYASKIGNIPIVLHRIPKGKIKTLTIKVNRANQWFACFSCEVQPVIPAHTSKPKEPIGIDVGIENFATLSNSETVANPKFLLKSETRLKLLHRRVSRKKKGSANRRKARYGLSRGYLKVTNQRSDFIHKLTRSLAFRYSKIYVEDLNIKSMVQNHCLAKHISDASWSAFIRNLEYKAVTCGSELIKVNPRNTSKTCSSCGTIIEMPLSERQFNCPNCGLVGHRDWNAAVNILKVGQGLPELNACEHDVRLSLGKAGMDEAGTIC